MQEPIRWGILGAGTAAHDFAMGLRYVAGASITAVASRTRASAELLARRYGVARVHDSRESLVADAAIDIIYIATPHSCHTEDALACLNAGKPVLCEKPLAISVAGASRIVETARSKRLFCMEAVSMRCLPIVQKARDLVRGGKIGEIRLISADFGVPAPFDAQSRLYSRALGGGALLDRGIYGISLALLLLGEPRQVSGQAIIGPTGVDHACTSILTYGTGALATMSATLEAWTPTEATISGTRGDIVLHYPFFRTERLSLRHSAPPAPAPTGSAGGPLKHSRLLRAARMKLGRLVPPVLHRKTTDLTAAHDGNVYSYAAREAMRCLKAGKLESPANPLDDSLAVLRITDELARLWSV